MEIGGKKVVVTSEKAPELGTDWEIVLRPEAALLGEKGSLPVQGYACPVLWDPIKTIM